MILTPGRGDAEGAGGGLARGGDAVLDPAARAAIEAAAARVAAAAAGGGAGLRGEHRLRQARERQGAGGGHRPAAAEPDPVALRRGRRAATPAAVVRLMMALKLVSLGRGASGVRWALVELLQGMLAAGVVAGGAGAGLGGGERRSGAAGAHGGGDARRGRGGGGRPRCCPAAAALAAAGLAPIALAAKEGLALINGTQFSTAWALAGLFGAWRAGQNALLISAMSTDAIMGSTAPLRAEIHALRGHRGQIEAAAVMRAIMAGSAIRESHREGDSAGAGPLLHPLPAAGDRRGAGPPARGGGDAGGGGERGHGQSAGAGGRRSSRGATSTPSRWPSRRTSSRWRWPRSARSPSGGWR